MKQLITAITPAPVLEGMKKTKDWLGLSIVAELTFDVMQLRAEDTLILTDLLANKEAEVGWKQDQAVIRTRYGDTDAMGGVNPGDRRALYYLTTALDPSDVLEIGTHIGASTIHIGLALKRLKHGGKMITVDVADVNHPDYGPWKQLGLPASPKEAAIQLGCVELITFHTGSSLDFMIKTRRRFDLIFLDGDHRAQTVYREIKSALSVLKPGGLILLHDYYPRGENLYPESATISGPFLALRRIERENPSIAVIPLGELPWPTKLGTHSTSLAAVVRRGSLEGS
jgi:predicted O-methyltransferase YrrM